MNIGIVGYGKLGRAIEKRVSSFQDIKVGCIISRRTEGVISESGIPIITMEQALSYARAIDCMIIAVGSENDATKAVSKLATRFNTVDCFDMHRYGTKHRKIAENTAKNSNHVSVCMSGWDPGLLSVIRLYLSAFIPGCEPKTFWGEGISQGHTNAVKNIRGVIDAVQYTIPIREAKDAALRGDEYSGVSHKRRCLISCLEGEEKRIEKTIGENEYFHGSDTEIVFVSSPEFLGHNKFYHKGEVIATDRSAGEDFGTLAHFTVEMNSNPDFTAGILLATARAAYKLYNEGKRGAFTLFDIPPRYFCAFGDPYSML